MDEPAIERLSALATLRVAAGWLVGLPALAGVFLLSELFGVVAELLGSGLGIVSSLVALFVGGMAHVAATDAVRGRRTRLSDAAEPVVDRYLSLVGVLVVYTVATAVGFLLLVLPGLYVGARLLPSFPACVVDDMGVVDSLSTGWSVGGGNVLKLVGILVLFLLMLFGLFLAGAVLGGVEILEDPRFLVAMAPVGAAVSGVVELSIGRIYLENRPEGLEGLAV